MVKVNGKSIPFYVGMTVGDALEKAGERLQAMTLVMINEEISNIELVKNKKIEIADEIVVFTLISGG